MADSQPDEIPNIAARRSQQLTDDEALLEPAINALRNAGATAYVETFESTPRLRQLPDVRVVVAVAVGDPLTPLTGTYVWTFAPDPEVDVKPAHTTAITMAALTAVDPDHAERCNAGLLILGLIDTLNSQVEAGDAEAGQALNGLLSALDSARTASSNFADPGGPEPS
jgi:hypothetical protein